MESLDFEDGVYRTAPKSVSLLARAMPSVIGFWRVLRCVYWSSRMAKQDRYGDEEWSRSTIGVIRALESVGIRFEIDGMENVKSFDGPCVFVSNHMSTLETFCLPGIILPFKRMTFVVKESLVRYPVFGHIMRATDAIPVTRKTPREDLRTVLEGGERKLRGGISVVIFPQTTRTTEFNPSDFNTLGVKLARRAEVPVVPVAVKTDAWGVGPLFLKDFGKIDSSKKVLMSFGRPLAISGRGDEEHNKVVDFITAKLREWRD